MKVCIKMTETDFKIIEHFGYSWDLAHIILHNQGLRMITIKEAMEQLPYLKGDVTAG